MADSIKWVVLEEVGLELQAHFLKTLLEVDGIPVHLGGLELMDQFAMAQRFTGRGIRVEVPEEHLSRARELLAELRARPGGGSIDGAQKGLQCDEEH